MIWEKVQNQPNDWKDFKLCTSKESYLNCVCEDLGEEVVFIDTEIWIDREGRKFMHEPHTKK